MTVTNKYSSHKIDILEYLFGILEYVFFTAKIIDFWVSICSTFTVSSFK